MTLRLSNTTAKNQLITSDTTRVLTFAELMFPSGWVRIHSGLGQKKINGNLFLGMGELLSIPTLSEKADSSPSNIKLSLQFNDMTLYQDVTSQDPVGLEANIYEVVYSETWQPLEVVHSFTGEITDMPIDDEGNYFIASVTLSGWAEIWNRPIENARISNEVHQSEYPGDLIFDQIETLAAQGIPSEIPGQYVAGNESWVSGSGRFR